MKQLAVLIPTYNGGERVRRSVESCALAGLAPSRYAVILVDNCSTDGSVEALPSCDAQGVPVQIFRNNRNLGRVANWNRALEIAESAGFSFATFLFAGDTWCGGNAVDALLTAMTRTDAVLGMAPLKIVRDQTARKGARISIPGDSVSIASNRLLEHVIRIGRLPFAPLQANIYRLFPERPLRFDSNEASALNTDIEATITWLQQHPGDVVLVAAPYMTWSDHSDRFLNRQDPWFVLEETRRTLERVSRTTGFEVDWRSANAVSLLMAARELAPGAPILWRMKFLLRVARWLKSSGGGLDLRHLLRFTLNKVLRRQSYLSLSEDAASNGVQHRQSDAAMLTRCGL